jgi:hypothetical protein
MRPGLMLPDRLAALRKTVHPQIIARQLITQPIYLAAVAQSLPSRWPVILRAR